MQAVEPVSCPFLPEARRVMSYRDLRAAAGDHWSKAQRAAVLIENAPRYAQYLWRQGQPARAILAICRVLYLPKEMLEGNHRRLFDLYRALLWIVSHSPSDAFLGNPRISFFHQATRARNPSPLFSARAWAAWYLVCKADPRLPADHQQREDPPMMQQLQHALNTHGIPAEGDLWIGLVQD